MRARAPAAVERRAWPIARRDLSARDVVGPSEDRARPEEGQPIVRLVEEPDEESVWVDVVPVRRDGTGRLVAVGLIRAADVEGAERWTTIGGTVRPDETIEQAIGRCVADTLGSEARAQLSPPPHVGMAGERLFDRRNEAPPSTDQREIEAPYAVDVRGRLVPQGLARRFAWFLITALPVRGEVSSEQWALLADFLDAQGEPGLAARMRQF